MLLFVVGDFVLFSVDSSWAGLVDNIEHYIPYRSLPVRLFIIYALSSFVVMD